MFTDGLGMDLLSEINLTKFLAGSRAMELAMKLVQLSLGKLSLGFISNTYLEELSIIVSFDLC